MENRNISNLSAALETVRLRQQNQPEQESGNEQQISQVSNNDSQNDEATQAMNQGPDQSNQDVVLDRIGRYRENLPDSGVTLFSHQSAPNGFKVAVVLAELGIKFKTIFLDLKHNEQRSPYYVQLNPNARVPTIIDHDNNDLAVWESGAILLYLVQRSGPRCALYSEHLDEQSQIMSWVFFQATGHAPMIGQALHFQYFHQESVPSAVQRYNSEVRRFYSVVEMRLAEKREQLIIDMDDDTFILGTTPLSESKYFDEPVWLVGDRITVADLSFVTWNHVVDKIGINLVQDFPEVYKWTRHMMRRPTVLRALSGLE